MDSQYQDNQNVAQEGQPAATRPTVPLIAPQPQTTAPKAKKSRRFPDLMLALMMVFGMLLGGAGGGTAVLLLEQQQQATAVAAAPATTSTGQEVSQVEANTIASVYDKVSQSVVRITTTTVVNTRRAQGQVTGVGSGIVLDTQGYVLTNNHVVDGASTLKVEFADGSEYDATVIGTSPQNDLAVIKVSAPAEKLVPATLGDSSTVQAGDMVIAVGYPYGLDQSVTSGIVSGTNREYDESAGQTMTGLIQTDAAINPGNSGGPLLNTQGEVVGINTMIDSPVEGFTGVGLVIPINQAKALLPQLEQGG